MCLYRHLPHSPPPISPLTILRTPRISTRPIAPGSRQDQASSSSSSSPPTILMKGTLIQGRRLDRVMRPLNNLTVSFYPLVAFVNAYPQGSSPFSWTFLFGHHHPSPHCMSPPSRLVCIRDDRRPSDSSIYAIAPPYFGDIYHPHLFA